MKLQARFSTGYVFQERVIHQRPQSHIPSRARKGRAWVSSCDRQLLKNLVFLQNDVLFHIFLEAWGPPSLSFTFSVLMEKGLQLVTKAMLHMCLESNKPWCQEGGDNVGRWSLSAIEVHVVKGQVTSQFLLTIVMCVRGQELSQVLIF